MNVEGARLKHASWRNWGNYFLVLFVWKIVLAACDGLIGGVCGISHRASDLLCLPVRIVFFINIQDLKEFFV